MLKMDGNKLKQVLVLLLHPHDMNCIIMGIICQSLICQVQQDCTGPLAALRNIVQNGWAI